MSHRPRILFIAALAAAISLLGSSVALGTPPSGVTGTVWARGTATEKVKVKGNEPYQVVVQNIVVTPGGSTGWHTHPGMAIAVVKSGTLTIYNGDDADCTPHTYTAGMVYMDPGTGHVHIARNESTTETLEIWVTYLDVPEGGAFRIDAPDPGNCGF